MAEIWAKHGRISFGLFPQRRQRRCPRYFRRAEQPDRKQRVILAEATDASRAAILIAIPINWCSCNTRALSLMWDDDKSAGVRGHPKSRLLDRLVNRCLWLLERGTMNQNRSLFHAQTFTNAIHDCTSRLVTTRGRLCDK